MEIAKFKSRRLIGKRPTYDLTVEEDHSYIANDVVVHNTTRYKHVGVNF